MSFLNSVLNNIGKPGERPLPPPLIQTKRKAEDEAEKPNGKISRTNTTIRPGVVPIQGLATNGKNGSSQSLTVPYRGTGKAGSTSAPTTPTAETPKQLKKGSFREIMARAKAGNISDNKPVVGTITHKTLPKEVSRKKDQRLQRRKSAVEQREGSRRNSTDRGSKTNIRVADLKKERKEKKDARPQPSYSGTAKPKARDQPSYKGTVGSRPSSVKTTVKPKRSRNEYAGTDDEIDSYGEEEDDDGYGYSDESDDMEAGYLDVEEEEDLASKIARKEDEEELKRENALKQQKEEKKRKMRELISRRGPQKY